MGFGFTLPFLVGVRGLCGWAWVLACTPPLLAGVVCALRLYPAVPGSGVQCGCVCLGSGFGCRPPLLAGVLGCVCVYVRALLRPCHSWLRCAVWVCASARVLAAPCHSWPGCWGVGVLVCALRSYPATPGWVMRCGCVFCGSGFGCAPPPLLGVLGCVCVCVRAPPVPRHFWLGRAVRVCVLGLGFRLRPATPSWGVGVCVCLCVCSACTPPLLAEVCGVVVCLGSGFGCAPPLLPGLLGCLCVCVRAFLLPCRSWMGCAVCVCVFRLGFRLCSASPGCGFGVCVCLFACSACTPPLLAGACGAGVCAWARVSAAPCHSWLGCWGMCVFVCLLRLYLATPGWSVWCGCVCLASGFDCAPPLLAGVLGCVCVCVRAPPVPCHSWLGYAVWVRVPGLGFRLRPAILAWGVGVCGCFCACSACTPPLLAGVCGVGVCACARVSAAPPHSWLGCLGVCVFLCVLRFYPATPGGSVCVCVGLRLACTPLFSGLGVGARGLVRVLRPCSATFWWGCPWWGGVRGLPWVGFVPPPPLLFFFFSALRGGGVGPVVSWLCGVRRCLSRSWDSWSPSPLPLSLGLRLWFFFSHLCSSGLCVGVSGVPFSSGRVLLSAGCR